MYSLARAVASVCYILVKNYAMSIYTEIKIVFTHAERKQVCHFQQLNYINHITVLTFCIRQVGGTPRSKFFLLVKKSQGA